MVLFLAIHVISITYGLFPQDLPGAAMTFTGLIYLVITVLIVPLTILAPLLVGFGLRKIKGFESYGKYSVITGILILIAGGSAALFFATQWPYFRRVERVNIGVLQLWMLVTLIRLFTMKEPSI